MAKEWRFTPHDESLVRRISSDLKVSPLLAQVLISRGLTNQDQAVSFLDARLTDLIDPELLPGIPEAADRIVTAIKQKRRITIYGDYDVDGVTATSLLWHCLRLAGGNVDYYIPSRMEEGYGLNCEALRQLSAEDPQRLVVTVDCGICSVNEAGLARELGLELIITDHHHMERELPEACLVHPRLPGGSYPFGDLCGAGVAFKLAWAVCSRLGDGKRASPPMREFLKGAVGLAAMGTIADVVPLLGENRVIVRYGLATLPERTEPGLCALLKVCSLHGIKTLDADNIGFAVAPRINAAGRLGQARLAVELLTCSDPTRAATLADYLNQLNGERRKVELRIFKEAKQLVADHPEWEEAPALVLCQEGWHPGVIGIVASRVVEHFGKPTLMIAHNTAMDLGQGSGRTCRGVDLHAAVSACSSLLVSYGGHQAAVGLKVRHEQIDELRERFCQAVQSAPLSEDRQSTLRIDAEVRLADCTPRAVHELERLGPFGQLNSKPIFAATRVELAEPPRTMGDGGRHLSLRLHQHGARLRAVAFGKGDWAQEIEKVGGPISISFAPGINRFQGMQSVELQLHDWRPA